MRGTVLTALIGLSLFVLACSGDGQAPAASSTTASQPAAAPSPTPTPDLTAVCRALAGGRPCYTGPLFDAHLHVSAALPQGAGSGSDLLRILDRDGVGWALGFYGAMGPLRAPNELTRVGRIASEARARIVPLLQPVLGSVSRYLEDFPAGAELDSVLRANMRPQGPYAGIGEVALYFPSASSLTFQSPEIESILGAVGATRGLVMIHPRSARQPQPTTRAEVEEALRRHPDVTFVLHGELDVFDLIEPLMARYPNLLFSLDFPTWATGPRGVSWGGSVQQGGSTQQFLADFDRVGLDAVVEQALSLLAARITRQPERVMWGTDRFLAWHFDAETSARVMAISRVLIARLPPELREAFAYRNAQRVLGPYLQGP